MSTRTEHTLAEMILLAAHELESQRVSPFRAEDLIVKVWQAYPHQFGLTGYADKYPDSNRVLASIMGKRGLINKGWLLKKGKKLYTLSTDGQREVRRITTGEEPEALQTELNEEKELILRTMLESEAWKLHKQNKAESIRFPDACRFWGLPHKLTGEIIEERFQMINSALRLEDMFKKQSKLTIDDHELTKSDLRELQKLHQELRSRFTRHLRILQSR